MPSVEVSMKGKNCLVTGATSGIGLVTAEALARKGASVVIVGRNPQKAAGVVEAIRNRTGNPEVEALIGDLASQADVRRIAAEYRGRWPRLDVLVNNAGAVYAKRRLSPDGLELTFALNHLGYFLLTNLLLDRLRASAPSRIVSVSSDAHYWGGGIRFDDLQSERSYGGFRAYGRSKLANILFTKGLARRLEGTGVTANALHPGVVATNILGGNGLIGVFWRLGAKLFLIPPEQGAETSIYLATSPEVEGQTGQYFIKKKVAIPSPMARDPEAAERLWTLSEELVGLGAHATP